MDNQTSTYEVDELIGLALDSQNADSPLTVYVPDCEDYIYFVRELNVSAYGFGAPDEPPSFELSGDDSFECTKHAGQIHKTYNSAKLFADKKQEELEERFGGKTELDKLRQGMIACRRES